MVMEAKTTEEHYLGERIRQLQKTTDSLEFQMRREQKELSLRVSALEGEVKAALKTQSYLPILKGDYPQL